MNYEQKYIEAVKKVKNKILSDLTRDSWVRAKIYEIFPELAESEDERIRKRIIDSLHGDVLELSEIDEAIAWLEKQGEQKQTWEPDAAQLIVIKDLIEDKNTSKVNKVILRDMFDEFKQVFGL